MARALRSVKTFKKSWDADKALKSTYQGKFGLYQLRGYIFLAVGYAVVVAWLTQMPTFALLMPKEYNCTPIYLPTNGTVLPSNGSRAHARRVLIDGRIKREEAKYSHDLTYGRTALTEFNAFCDPVKIKLPHIVYLIGLVLGGLVFGCIADHSGRKMVLVGSMWTACGLSVFQLLSEDYISYVFFIFFVGIAIGAVQVIAVPFVIEMFSTENRAIYGLLLTGVVFLFDLIIPGLAFLIKNWKILQGVVSAPLVLTAVLYWYSEESMFWYTTKKDYVTAVLSLTKIAQFNGIVFEEIFREARDFLRGKRSKGIQCDFQPLLRLEDIKSLGSKYPDFDMVDLQATMDKKKTFTQRIAAVLTGHDYNPTLSTFYPTDFLHSSILTLYLLIMCALWLVSSLTEYSLDAVHLIQYLPDNFFLRYLYTHLVQIGSFLIGFPMVYKWGRRWPTFCFFLIAEVCLLGSATVRPGVEETRVAMLIVYFVGKFACRGAFLVILLYTCEIFPTGLRCTTLGICYTFRLIGVALASSDLAGLNDWMPRLIYGLLSLVLGALALLLPETKKFALPRTIIQVEVIPTSISRKFRRQRSAPAKRAVAPDGPRPEGGAPFNDAASSVSGIRSVRFGPYDNQSTLHSVYELQEYNQDDTVQSSAGRYSRRADLRNPSIFQPVGSAEAYRQQTPIAEDGEYDEDVDDDRTRLAQHQRLSLQQRSNAPSLSGFRADVDPTSLLNAGSARQAQAEAPSQLEVTAQIQAGDVTVDESAEKSKQDENGSQAANRPLDEAGTFPPNISEEENYFSEHC